jgi:hypothetical protein
MLMSSGSIGIGALELGGIQGSMPLSPGACVAKGELAPGLALARVSVANVALSTGLDKTSGLNKLSASVLVALGWRHGLGEREPEEDAVVYEGTR